MNTFKAVKFRDFISTSAAEILPETISPFYLLVVAKLASAAAPHSFRRNASWSHCKQRDMASRPTQQNGWLLACASTGLVFNHCAVAMSPKGPLREA